MIWFNTWDSNPMGKKIILIQNQNNKNYRQRQVATKKPGVDDFYVKNVYSEIADYPKRKVGYYDDKLRYESIYTTDYIKNLKEDNFTKGRDQTLKDEIAKYEYSENPTAFEIVNDKSLRKNEPYIRQRL